MPAPWPESMEESEAKRPRVTQDQQPRNKECRRSIQSAGGNCWSTSDLVLAASLLQTPNARFPSITFKNLEEKRRVFTLVYDVLRYKSVLNEALDDVYFFTRFSHLKERCHLVWLLFLDLYKRDFTQRDPLDPDMEKAFSQHRLFEIDEHLWQLRVKLAATVSRLRIKNGAHSLSSLLPRHLRLTRSLLEENIISGWVNIFKTTLRDACDCLNNLGFLPLSRDKDALEPLTFKTDHLLPRFLHMMPHVREDLVESSLVRDQHLIMQERTFCLGPAVMAQLLKDYALSGKVAQTHVNSPITMAYFANLLINNDKIESLLVFGAGYRKEACEQYLQELGVKNTRVYAENFAHLASESRVLDNVIAVLATPPNTNSSVVDPVDLAVARGGDLQILQQLTDVDFASTPQGENINKYLLQQRDALRRAMSKPQIQFVVYETHSRFTCENEEMASALVNELNNYATEIHLEELRKAQGESQEREKSQLESTDSQVESQVPSIKVEDELSLPMPAPVQSIVIPPSDLFELSELPDLCPNSENCLDLITEGTYIAVIKRKEITRLDPKYMIQMAEARGLFGRADGTPKTKTAGQTARAKAALAALQARSDSMEKNKTKVKVEMDRIAAPTRASLLRDIHPPSTKECPRFTHHLAHDGTPSYKLHFEAERKTFLTPFEEEELIRRLYVCPRINLFTPKLYEDLPPLKFWDSPASVIENYLQRKVFQKRLQLAYEFNQNKEPNNSISDDTFQKTPEQLTKAMLQLTEDVNYFENAINFYSIKKLQEVEEEKIILKGSDDQNKALWNKIYPEKTIESDLFSENTDVLSKTEGKSKSEHYPKALHDIKNRYLNYKKFYRLRNLNPEDKKPLALTIGASPVPPLYSEGINEAGGVSFSFNYEEADESLNKTECKTHKIKSHNSLSLLNETLLNKPQSIHKETTFSSGRAPIVKYSSLTDTSTKQNHEQCYEVDSIQEVAPEDQLKPLFSSVICTKDSLVLTHERMSRVSRIGLPENLKTQFSTATTLASHRDSYTMLISKRVGKSVTLEEGLVVIHDNETNFKEYDYEKVITCLPRKSTLVEHRDSVILALQKMALKDRVPVGDSVSCDICNNRFLSVQIVCNFHANMLIQRQKKALDQKSSPSNNLLTVKDSVDLAYQKKHSKEITKYSAACQTNEIEIKKEISPPINPHSQKQHSLSKEYNANKVTEEMYNNLTITSPKLKNYLMNAIQINQIKINEDFKSS